jgi:hypothetical protein
MDPKLNDTTPVEEKDGAFVLKSLAPDKPLPALPNLSPSKGQSWLDAIRAELAPGSNRLRRYRRAKRGFSLRDF